MSTFQLRGLGQGIGMSCTVGLFNVWRRSNQLIALRKVYHIKECIHVGARDPGRAWVTQILGPG